LGERAFDQRGIVLERGAVERLAAEEEHDEVRSRLELLPVALRAELRDVRADLARVIPQSSGPHVLVVGLDRLEVALQRHLRIDDDVLAARQLYDEIRSEAAVVRVDSDLLDEVAVRQHPGHLDDPAKLDLPPTPARRRRPEGGNEVAGL